MNPYRIRAGGLLYLCTGVKKAGIVGGFMVQAGKVKAGQIPKGNSLRG